MRFMPVTRAPLAEKEGPNACVLATIRRADRFGTGLARKTAAEVEVGGAQLSPSTQGGHDARRPRPAAHGGVRRRAQLMQPGERELHLGLNACSASHATPHRMLGDVLQQRCLAHTCVPADCERPALSARTASSSRSSVVVSPVRPQPSARGIAGHGSGTGTRSSHGCRPRSVRGRRYWRRRGSPASRPQSSGSFACAPRGRTGGCATPSAVHGRYLDFARKRKGDALLVVLPAVILLA